MEAEVSSEIDLSAGIHAVAEAYNWVVIKQVGGTILHQYNAQTQEAAQCGAEQINRIIAAYQCALADATRRAGEYAHRAGTEMERLQKEIDRLRNLNGTQAIVQELFVLRDANQHYAADAIALEGRLAEATAEVARLTAIIERPAEVLFDGREPTRNERHLTNILSWRQSENQRMREEVQHVRQECERVVRDNPLVQKLARLLKMVYERIENQKELYEDGEFIGTDLNLQSHECREILKAIEEAEGATP
jgi:hypothetical protein